MRPSDEHGACPQYVCEISVTDLSREVSLFEQQNLRELQTRRFCRKTAREQYERKSRKNIISVVV